VEAIYQDINLPPHWSAYIPLNAERVKSLKPAGARVTEKRGDS
jgi:hypothetical protein